MLVLGPLLEFRDANLGDDVVSAAYANLGDDVVSAADANAADRELGIFELPGRSGLRQVIPFFYFFFI